MTWLVTLLVALIANEGRDEKAEDMVVYRVRQAIWDCWNRGGDGLGSVIEL